MNGQNGQWMPSRREQRILWWLRLVTRYVVGVGGLTWALATNHIEAVLLMVLGALATSTDVFAVAKDLISAAREEARDRATEGEKRNQDLSNP